METIFPKALFFCKQFFVESFHPGLQKNNNVPSLTLHCTSEFRRGFKGHITGKLSYKRMEDFVIKRAEGSEVEGSTIFKVKGME